MSECVDWMLIDTSIRTLLHIYISCQPSTTFSEEQCLLPATTIVYTDLILAPDLHCVYDPVWLRSHSTHRLGEDGATSVNFTCTARFIFTAWTAISCWFCLRRSCPRSAPRQIGPQLQITRRRWGTVDLGLAEWQNGVPSLTPVLPNNTSVVSDTLKLLAVTINRAVTAPETWVRPASTWNGPRSVPMTWLPFMCGTEIMVAWEYILVP